MFPENGQPRNSWNDIMPQQKQSCQANKHLTQGGYQFLGHPPSTVRDQFPPISAHYLHNNSKKQPLKINNLGSSAGTLEPCEDGVVGKASRQYGSAQSSANNPLDQASDDQFGFDPHMDTNHTAWHGPADYVSLGQPVMMEDVVARYHTVTQPNLVLEQDTANAFHELPPQQHMAYKQLTDQTQLTSRQQQQRHASGHVNDSHCRRESERGTSGHPRQNVDYFGHDGGNSLQAVLQTGHQKMLDANPPPASINQPQMQHQERLKEAVSDRLVAVRDLPVPFQRLFPNFRYFNPLQSECFQEAYGSDVNMVVSAPTGSGKTGVMELALLRLLSENLQQPDERAQGEGGGASGGNLRLLQGTKKGVYVAPLRALVQEKCKDWKARFGALLGLSVLELSGDSEPDAAELEAADILCTTPEKLDAISRKLSEQNRRATFLSDIRLVLIDEVHLLNESERGSALEAGVVSRLNMVAAFPELREHAISRLRFVAVSATIPNVQDIANWLRVPPQGLKVYGEEMRPVRLRTVVRTYAPAKNDFLFERRLDTFLPGVISESSAGKPTLVFCSSRKGTIDSATYLASRSSKGGIGGGNGGTRSGNGSAAVPIKSYVRNAAHADRLTAAARDVAVNKQLQACLLAGVGFHNAAMETHQREVVERLFLAGDLPILCSTSTLALGVNLPAHLVIIRGTRRYCGPDGGGDEGGSTTGYKEYDRSVCLQMVGRAGRPQFDSEGVAVIMTQKETHARYANLLGGSEPVDSCLHECFADHLNAEVVLETIRDMDTATQWLKTTFLYVRVRQAPRAYGLDPPSAALASDAVFDRWLTGRLVGQAVARLAEFGLVTQDPNTGSLRALEPGRIMAHSYIRMETMKAITQVGLRAGMISLLRVIAVADEFSNIRLRRGEKRVLNEINKRIEGDNAIKYPVPADGPSTGTGAKGLKPKDRISKSTEKVFIMVNEALSDCTTEVLDYSMRQELEGVLRVGQRIAGAMARYFDFRHALAATANSLCLAKSLRQRMWDDSKQTARQLPDIGRLLAHRLSSAGLGRLRQLALADPRRIEAVTQKGYPFGNTIRSHLAKLLPPEIQLRLKLLNPGCNPKSHFTQPIVEVELVRLEPSDSSGGIGGPASRRTPAHLLVGLSNTDQLLRHERLIVETFTSPYRCQVAVSPTSQAPTSEPLHVLACLILERTCGLDVHASIRLTVIHGSVVAEDVDGPAGGAWAPAGESIAPAAGPGERFAYINDAALQPSPFLLRPSCVHPGMGDEEIEVNMETVMGPGIGSSTHASSSERAGQPLNQTSQQCMRERGPGNDGWRASRQKVIMMEAPALAAPAFAMEAAGPTNTMTLYKQLPPQRQKHQSEHEQNPEQQEQEQQHRKQLQAWQQPKPSQQLQQEQQQPAPSPPQVPVPEQQHRQLSLSSAPLEPWSGDASFSFKDTSIAAAKADPKRASGAGRNGGGKQAQGLSMSGASLAGAKRVPAFARLLALANKPVAPVEVSGTTPASPKEGGPAQCCTIADKPCAIVCGVADCKAGRNLAGDNGQQGGAEPLDDLFAFLLCDSADVANPTPGSAAVESEGAKRVQPCGQMASIKTSMTLLPHSDATEIGATPAADAGLVVDSEPAVNAAPAVDIKSAADTEPGSPKPDATPASVQTAAHSSAPPLSSQVLLLHRPGMSSCEMSTVGIPREPAAHSPAVGRPQRPCLFGPSVPGVSGVPVPQPSTGSKNPVLSERKRLMLRGRRDSCITVGLRLMQQRQARNTANGAAISGLTQLKQHSYRGVGTGSAAVSGAGVRDTAGVLAVTPPKLDSLSFGSAMLLSSRGAHLRDVASTAQVEEEFDGDFDSIKGPESAILGKAEVPDMRRSLYGWSNSDTDGVHGGNSHIIHQEAGPSVGRKRTRDVLSLRRTCNGAGIFDSGVAAGTINGWSEYLEEPDAAVRRQQNSSQPCHAGQEGSAWQAAEILRQSYFSGADMYLITDDSQDGGRVIGDCRDVPSRQLDHRNLSPVVGTDAGLSPTRGQDQSVHGWRRNQEGASLVADCIDVPGFNDGCYIMSDITAVTSEQPSAGNEPAVIDRTFQALSRGLLNSHNNFKPTKNVTAVIVASDRAESASHGACDFSEPCATKPELLHVFASACEGTGNVECPIIGDVVLCDSGRASPIARRGGNARPAASRYSGLASLSQRLKKRKGPAITGAPQPFRPSPHRPSFQLNPWKPSYPVAEQLPPQQLQVKQALDQDRQQPPEQQDLRQCGPSRGRDWDSHTFNLCCEGAAGMTSMGWRQPSLYMTDGARRLQDSVQPQLLPRPEPLVEPIPGPTGFPGVIDLDNDADNPQDWLGILFSGGVNTW